MTDRDLLELAAKAAGYTLEEHFDVHGNYWPWCVELDDYWCPVTDDGDALRLAVKLNINLSFYPEPDVCEPWVEALSPETASDELLAADPYAATRRAIVRAAAEIGRNMK